MPWRPRLSAVSDDWPASNDSAIWVTSAYLLAYAVPLLITGRLGDRYGPKRIYILCLAGFTLASFLCGLAGGLNSLVAFRILQAIPGGVIPVTMVDGEAVGNGEPGPLTRQLREAYWELHDDPRFSLPVPYN